MNIISITLNELSFEINFRYKIVPEYVNMLRSSQNYTDYNQFVYDPHASYKVLLSLSSFLSFSFSISLSLFSISLSFLSFSLSFLSLSLSFLFLSLSFYYFFSLFFSFSFLFSYFLFAFY